VTEYQVYFTNDICSTRIIPLRAVSARAALKMARREISPRQGWRFQKVEHWSEEWNGTFRTAQYEKIRDLTSR
jgi:hypothetical protein